MPSLLTTGNKGSNSPVLLTLLVSGIILAFISIIILGAMITKVKDEKAAMEKAKPTAFIPTLCTTRDCLWEASELTQNMNFSADPCNDFYQFSCGNYRSVHPPPNWWTPVTMLSVLGDINDDKLKDSLESPVKDKTLGSAEAKGKTYFMSCIDDYFKTKTGGKPLANDISIIGGWYPLYGTFSNNSWGTAATLNAALQHAHTDYYTNPFFTINVAADWDSVDPNAPAEKYMVQFDITTLGMGRRSYYLTNTTNSVSGHCLKILVNGSSYWTQRHVQGYKTFIQGLIKLLIRDSGITNTPNVQQVLDTTFNDILYVETQLANITENTVPASGDVHKTVQYIVDNFKGKVAWLDLLQNYYPNTGISSTTLVHLHEEQYMQTINDFINTLSPRQLNNYIMWKVASTYVTDLGWEYIHLNREWAMVKYNGYVYFTGQYNWCVIQMQRYLSHLLSSFFIADNFPVSQPLVQNIFDTMKSTMKSRINSYSWLDSKAKTEAGKKFDSLKDKIGHPAWLTDPTQVNAYYQTLSIQKDMHFKNIQHIYNFDRLQEDLLLKAKKIDQNKWPEGIYQTTMWYTYDWNEMYIPAGFLQHPIYDARVPQYVNFASMGRWVGRFLGYVEGPSGYYYDHNGYYMKNTWWSQDSLDTWKNEILPCHQSRYVNETYCAPFRPCQVLPSPTSYTRSDYQYSLAINVSYTAYHSYIAKNGGENALPGFYGNSTEQLFFLSFAQSFCQSEDPFYQYFYWKYGVQPEILVNVLMREFPAFAKAYNCPATSKMAQPKAQCRNM